MTLQYGSHGDAVKLLQRRLNDNKYHDCHLKVDGQFGSHTASAVHEVKWFMGYRAGSCAPVAGVLFEAIITGKVPLTATQRKRRAERMDVSPWEAKRHSALEKARATIGIAEGPNNDILFNRWWCDGRNDGAPYCVRALSYWWHPYCTAVVRGSRWQGTDALLADAKAGRYGVRLIADPAPGDIGVIDFNGHSNPDHGFMVERDDGGSVHTIEANAGVRVATFERSDRNCWYMRITK